MNYRYLDKTITDDLTVMIITFNEAANIERTLKAVSWAKRVLIIDSGSTDATLEIAARFHNTHVIFRTFDSFAQQCNFGLSQIRTGWVLSLDADYEISSELASEIQKLEPPDTTGGFRSRFIYRIEGHSLSGSLYPPRVVLYRTKLASYNNEGHGHRVRIVGKIRELNGRIYHDDRKSFERWVRSQQNYARSEAEYLLSADPTALSMADRIRLIGWPAPFLVFIYALFWKRCLFDGSAGWIYTLQRLLAELMIALELCIRRITIRR